ncbi:hypothetical protein ABIB87_001291 [Bradyrhizobium sp. JR18.2]
MLLPLRQSPLPSKMMKIQPFARKPDGMCREVRSTGGPSRGLVQQVLTVSLSRQRVKMRRTQSEQSQSALPHQADLNERCRHFADGPLAEVGRWIFIAALAIPLSAEIAGSTVSATCSADQGLDGWQHARDDCFVSSRVGVQTVQRLELSIVNKRIIKSRVKQHIVLAGKTREHSGKSVLVFVSKYGLGPQTAKEHGYPPGFEFAKNLRE